MGFVEVQAPDQFKFEKIGDYIKGRLLSITKTTVKGKPALQYMTKDDRDHRFTFLATWDLAQKIDATMIGCDIYVELKKFDTELGRQGNAARIFFVSVDRESKDATQVQGPQIGDEDIPF